MAGSETRSRPKPIDLGALVAGIGLAFGVITAGLFLAGWSYARAYLSNFQLGYRSIDLPYETLLLYGFSVTEAYRLWLLAIALVLVGITIWRPWRHIHVSAKLLILPGLFALIPAFAITDIAAGSVAHQHFEKEREDAFPYHRRVKVFVDNPDAGASTNSRQEEGEADLNAFPRDLHEGCYRLFIKDNDNIILFRPVDGLEEFAPPTVFLMPWSKVKGLWILADSDSCS